MKRRIIHYPFRPQPSRERPALRLVREGGEVVVLPFPQWAALHWRASQKDDSHAES
jgi:hypothetical protein